MYDPETKKIMYAHRYFYEKRFGAVPAGLFVCHTCDNRSCVNPEHLFLGTNEDNMKDAAAKGRTARGEKNGQVKLTSRQILKIRGLYQSGLTQQKIADRFGIHQVHVSDIILRRRWAWL